MRCCAARAIQREASPAVGRAKKPSTHRSRTSVENDKSRAREGDRVTPLRLPDPPLADERVLLRPWQVADLAVIELASRDPAITVGTSVPTPYSEAAGDAWLSRQHAQREQRTGISMAIADPRTGQALGYVGVSGLVWRHLRGSLGYWVTGAQRRGGLARAAWSGWRRSWTSTTRRRSGCWSATAFGRRACCAPTTRCTAPGGTW